LLKSIRLENLNKLNKADIGFKTKLVNSIIIKGSPALERLGLFVDNKLKYIKLEGLPGLKILNLVQKSKKIDINKLIKNYHRLKNYTSPPLVISKK